MCTKQSVPVRKSPIVFMGFGISTKIMALVIVSFLLWSCEGNKQKPTETEKAAEINIIPQGGITDSSGVPLYKDDIIRNTEKDLFEKWFVYDRPINGYDIKIHWLCDKSYGYYGTGYFYFSNDSTTKTLTHTLDIDGWFDETQLMETPDTIVLNQYYDEALQPYLDWRTIVGFADYNFDGKIDLAICESPRPCHGFDPDNCLDCETFVFYSDYPEGFVQILNVPFYKLSTETCRTCCTFDTKNKTLSLLSHGGACCYTSETYYFEYGQPYKSIRIVHEEGGDGVIDDTTYHYYNYSW